MGHPVYLQVLIFNQSTTALVGYSGIDLAPGFLTQIGLTKVVREGLPIEEGGGCLNGVSSPFSYLIHQIVAAFLMSC